jgi:hypothetical protein
MIGFAGVVLVASAACGSAGGGGKTSQATSPGEAGVDIPEAGQVSVDAGAVEDGGASPTFLAHFDKSQGQLPEGLWQQQGTPVVGWAPLATLLEVAADGTTQPLGTAGVAANTFALGIVSGPDGTLYFGVGAASAVGGAPASAAPVTPAPGIYSLPADGGSAQVFSLGSDANPPMLFANGLAFQGNDLFVADSEGVIYEIDGSGTATVWSQDSELSASQPACAGVVPLAVGANGIVVTATDIFVTNTNYGRLLDFPIQDDGTAGAVTVIAEDCATLAGADGLVQDDDGSFLIAVNAQNRIARVTPSGAISVLAEGAPLDTPASVLIDTTTGAKRLLFTNSSFFSAADAGAPGLLALPLP